MTATAARRPSAPPGDELDDIFNYAANMDDVFRDVDTNMRPSAREDNPSQARNTSHTNNADSLGIDEQIKVTKKRAPIPKLDEGRCVQPTTFHSSSRAQICVDFSHKLASRS